MRRPNSLIFLAALGGISSSAVAADGDIPAKQKAMIEAFVRSDFSAVSDSTTENAMLMVMKKPSNAESQFYGRAKVLSALTDIRSRLGSLTVKKCDFTPAKVATVCEFDGSVPKPRLRMLMVSYIANVGMTAFAVGLEEVDG